ncbi:MAG: metallophosphoesterase [Candidatus Omnitrophota bacterium]
MNYWWTSDYHFSHFNIIRYCNRPFKTVEEMNETIIRKHNERVKPEDTVFFLGDFIFKGGKEGGEEKYRQFEKRLNGKFIFIKGNHDRNNSLRTIINKVYIHYGSKDICMTHRAEDADSNVPWNFCGHVHEKYKVKRLNDKSLVVNLCVEVWNYYPVTFEEISSAISAFKKEEKKSIVQGDTKGTNGI